MPTEKVTAQYIIDIDEKGVLEAERIRERLKSPVTTKLAMDLSALKEAKRLIDDEIKAKRIELKVTADPGKIAIINSELQKLGASSIKTAKEINQANKTLNNFVNTGNTELSKLGYYFQKLGVDIKSGLGKNLLTATEGIASFGSTAFSALGATAIATGLYSIGVSSLSLADRLEQATISFETMLGSAEDAKQLLKELSVFASKTPFELPDVRANAKQLLAMGIGVKDLIPTMKALGDVSAGLSVPMDRLALAYGQVIAKGKLQGGELKQFTEAGVPLIETLSKKLGVSTQEFYKMVEAGKVSSADVVQAFQLMTGEGGKFNDLMLKQSSTLSGMYSNFKDQLSLLGERIGTALLPAGKAIIGIGQDILSVVNSPQMVSLLGFAGKLLKAIYYLSGTFIVFETMKSIVNGITSAFEAMSPTIMYVADAIGTAMDALLMLIEQVKSYFTDMIDTITGSTSDSVNEQVSLWEYLGAFISTLFISLVGLLQGTFQTIADGWNSTVMFMTDDTTTTTEKIKSLFIGAGSAILNTILGIVNETINLILLPINTAIDGLNALSSLANNLGADIGKIGNLKVNLSVGDSQGVFDKIGGGFIKTMESFSKNVNNATQKTMDSVFENRMKSIEEKGKKEKYLSNKKVSVINDNGGGSSKGKSAKDVEKEKQKILDESAKSQEKYFKKMQDNRKNEKKDIEDYVKKLRKAKDDIISIDKDIEEALSGSKKEKSSTVASYMRGLLEEQKNLQAEAEKAINNGEVLDPTFDARKKKIQDLIDEAKNSGIITQQDIVKEDQRNSLDSLGKDRFDLQENIANIELEKEARVNELKQKQADIEAELGVKRDAIDKEIAIQELRARENELALREYASAIRLLEGDITAVTSTEVQKRIDMYNREMSELQRLIHLRTSAGVSTGGQQTQTTTNVTNNNTPTVNVQANVSNNVDVNYLANQLAKKVSLSNKGIN